MNLKSKFETMGWTFRVVNSMGECTIWFASPRMRNNFAILKDSKHLNEFQLWNSMTEDFLSKMELNAYADYFLKHLLDRKSWYIRNAILNGEPEFILNFD